MKKLRFRSKDGFESVWGLSWDTFGSSWGSLGGSLGALHRPQRASRFIWELSWTSFARFWLLLLVYVRYSFFDVVFYLLSVPLGGLYIDHKGLPDSSGNFLGPRLLASGCFCSFMFVILSSMSSFILFRCLLASILSSQANPPTLKNLDFLPKS